LVQRSWHLFVPPLLALLDDSTTTARYHGLAILINFLKKTPTKFLQQTGLGEVIEDAVIPTLLFLPSLTPVDESIMLLGPAYTALFDLASIQFPQKADQVRRMKLLDRVMRQGILQGFQHSGDILQIAELLLEKSEILISLMGVHAVKHLKVSHKVSNLY